MYAIHMCALSGIGNVPGLSAIFFMDLVTLFMYIQATTGTHESSLSLLEKLSKKYTFSILHSFEFNPRIN